MKNNSKINRRNAIKTMALGTTAMAIPNINSEMNSTLTPLKGNIAVSYTHLRAHET